MARAPRDGAAVEPAFSPYDTAKPLKPRDPDIRAALNGGDTAAVAAAIKDAELEADMIAVAGRDPVPGAPLEGMMPGEWTPDDQGCPPQFPIIPLGTNDGHYSFLDTIGQLRTLKDRDMAQAGINGLFMGRHHYLYWAFPKKRDDGAVTSWRPEKVREVLMDACARKGAFSAADRVRGRGFWQDQKGQLILHAGDRIVTAAGVQPLGEMEGMIYPTRPAIRKPWPVPLKGKPGPALTLLPHFKAWNWARPTLDPVLLLGWIGVAWLGGALKWRPEIFIMGDKATGKSSLQADLKGLFGQALMQAADTTAAGLYQQLQFDCLPVAVDEFEAKADTRKQKAVIELGRISCSGGPMFRGGESHKGTQFYGRSAFLFSAINVPPLDPQDLSRAGLLKLRKLAAGAVRVEIPDPKLQRLGREVMRRLMDNWHRFPATLTAWREFLSGCGHDGRGQDTFGTLMAVADLIIDCDADALGLEMGGNAENFESWREVLQVTRLAEYDDAASNWSLCLQHLMSQRIEAWRGGNRHTVGEVLEEFHERGAMGETAITYEQARRLLEQTGLTLMHPSPGAWQKGHRLFVPNQHPLLHTLFRDTKWQGEPNAGAWSRALDDADGRFEPASARIHGGKFKGKAFWLAEIIVRPEDGQ
jgi:hypothetical protein